MSNPNLNPSQLVLLNIFLLGRRIRKKIKHEDPAKMLNNTILILIEDKAQTISSLAKTLAISLSTTSEKINKLTQQGFISSVKTSDKRCNHLMLTAKGNQQLAKIKEHFSHQANLVLAGINANQQKIFLKILQQLQLNLERI